MAGERQLPGLGLYGYWDAGSNGWADQNDTNWRIVSALLQGSVIDRRGAVNSSPSQGDMHILLASAPANATKIALYDDGAWVYITPETGWLMFSRADDQHYTFDGTNWVQAFVTEEAPLVINARTSNYTLTTSDFEGDTLVTMDVAGANTVTVNSGLSVTHPVHVTQKGAGTTSFVAGSGVTIQSADAALKLRVQHSTASLIPMGADTYLLVGDIAA